MSQSCKNSQFEMAVINRTFQTRPVIIHAQGGPWTVAGPLVQKPAWPRIREALSSHQKKRVGRIPDLTLLTCNNGADAMGLFESSTAELGIPCLVRGAGIKPWINSQHKPAVILAALQEIDTEYVLHADSRDAVILRDPRPALNRFAQWDGCQLLFGGDRINWPALPEFRQFEQSLPGARETEFRFLNGGTWIGRTKFCREFFSAVVAAGPRPEAPDSEQGILKTVFPKFYPDVRIDYRCEIFQNIGLVLADVFDITFDVVEDAAWA